MELNASNITLIEQPVTQAEADAIVTDTDFYLMVDDCEEYEGDYIYSLDDGNVVVVTSNGILLHIEF